MNQWFRLNCDRYGHLIADVGRSSSKINRSRQVQSSGQITLAPRVAQSAESRSGETNSARFATANCRAEVAYPTNPCPNRRDSREAGQLKIYSEKLLGVLTLR